MRLLKWAAIIGIGALFMAGCQSPSSSAPAEGTAKTEATKANEKPLRIGVSVPAADHGWTAGVVWWAREAMKLHPEVQWTFKDAKDPATQINDIETMMAAGVDALVILATESAPLTPVAKKAKEQGIYIVNVDRGFLEPVADVFLEGDNASFGRKSAEFVVSKLGPQGGNIVVLTGIPSTVDTDRVKAAEVVFKANPQVKILDQQPGNWNQQKAMEVMQAMLLKHPKIDAVWAQDDDMALGVEKAIKEAGRTDIKWILGGAGMKDIVKRTMDGDAMYPGNVTYPPSMIAAGIHLAVANLRDGNQDKVKQFMPRHIKIDVDLVTPENAKEFYFPESVY